MGVFIAGLEDVFLQFVPGSYGEFEMFPAQASTSR